MSTRHALKSDGAWVELRDVDDLRAKDRKKINALVLDAIEIDSETGGIAGKSAAVARIVAETPDAVAALLITQWEIPYLPDAKIPSLDPTVLGELTLGDADRLAELIDPVVELLRPGASNNPDDHDKPASPSGPASG